MNHTAWIAQNLTDIEVTLFLGKKIGFRWEICRQNQLTIVLTSCNFMPNGFANIGVNIIQFYVVAHLAVGA